MKIGTRLLATVAVAAAITLTGLGTGGLPAAQGSCVQDVTGACARIYNVTGTNGSLAIQSEPYVNHVIGWLANGAAIPVMCQLQGGTDPYDNLTSHTWDMIGPGKYVYDWYVSTPPQDSSGWSPGVPRCVYPYAYPWPNVPNYVPDGHGYYEGECVSFAAWALRSIGKPTSETDGQGNADMWHGLAVDSGPHAGDVAQWDDNHNGAGSLGHVAYVQSVNGNGTVTVYEYNWGNFHQLNIRTISVGTPSRYLRY
jgi:surface antigen